MPPVLPPVLPLAPHNSSAGVIVTVLVPIDVGPAKAKVEVLAPQVTSVPAELLIL